MILCDVLSCVLGKQVKHNLRYVNENLVILIVLSVRRSDRFMLLWCSIKCMKVLPIKSSYRCCLRLASTCNGLTTSLNDWDLKCERKWGIDTWENQSHGDLWIMEICGGQKASSLELFTTIFLSDIDFHWLSQTPTLISFIVFLPSFWLTLIDLDWGISPPWLLLVQIVFFGQE